MRNETFFIGENQNPFKAVAFCAVRAFFTTAITTHPQPTYFIWFGDRYEAAGTLRHPPHSPSNQPRRFLAADGKFVRSCLPQPFFRILNSCFRKNHLANSLPVTDGMVKVAQTARLPMLCAFWKIELKETGCRFLFSSI
jgi:hypothetical protein